MTDLHFIVFGDTTICFNAKTLELFRVDGTMNKKHHLDNHITQARKSDDYVVPSMVKNVHRITLCVSNDCNLRCKYCYAQGGNYGSQRKIMEEKTARNFVDFCSREFDKVDRILFFGGEPLLNWKIIDLVCTLFERKSYNKELPLPSFSIVTNGTLFSEQIRSVIKKHISHVTVSVDGDKIVNDANRIFPNGSGSFDKISHFISEIKSIDSIKIGFEATYTSRHVNNGLTRFDVKTFLQSKFDIDGVVVDEDSLSKQNIIESVKHITIQKIVDSNFECLPLDFWHILFSVTSRKHLKFCTIFQDRFVITTEGYIVGCQMLIGKRNSVIGTINNHNISEKLLMHIHNFKDNNVCRKCWCNLLCGGCCIGQFYSKINGDFTKTPNAELCHFVQQYIEEILILIYKIRANDDTWLLLIKKCQQKLI